MTDNDRRRAMAKLVIHAERRAILKHKIRQAAAKAEAAKAAPSTPATPTATRSPERAKQVLDRAQQMRGFKLGMLDKGLVKHKTHPQIKNPGHVKSVPSFQLDQLKPKGEMAIPLASVRSEQAAISTKIVKEKIDAIARGALPETPRVVSHNGKFYALDGNHGMAAARALGQRTVNARVYEIAQSQMQRQLLSQAMAHASVAAAATTTAVTVGLAYKSAKETGASEMEAIGEAAMAGAAATALPATAGAATAIAARYGLVSKAALTVAGKAALPLSIAGTAAYYGWRAMQEGKGVSGTAKAAAWGALNGAIPVDLAMQAYGAIKGDKPAPGATAQARQPAPSAEQTQAFTSLNEKFQSSGPQPEANGEGKRGYANPKTQRAAQEARGVANFTDWAQA